MDEFICPICGNKNNCSRREVNDEIGYFRIDCSHGYSFVIAGDVFDLPKDLQGKLYNLVFEQLIHSPKAGNKPWYFFYTPSYKMQDTDQPQYVNLAESLQSYPTDLIDRTNRALLNLSIVHPLYGDVVGADFKDVHAVYSGRQQNTYDAEGLFDLLVDLGYLRCDPEHSSLYAISADGWKKVEELNKKQQEVKQGFIAMSFQAETQPIREAFRKAIDESGYAVRIIDEKEHNNQIVPEIFYEIGRSKFVVVDVTYPNYGAYYEAGYAQALEKQVIVCCKKEAFESKDGSYERPHFDISQKSMVVWEDADDLVARLKRRIEATVV